MDGFHNNSTLIWCGTDPFSRHISLYVPERDHIIQGHEIMSRNFTAIYDTIKYPDAIFESRDLPNREVFFKLSSKASYFHTGFLTKVIVEYDTKGGLTGYVISAWPQKRMDGNIGNKVYP